MHHSRTLSRAWNSYTLKGWVFFSINFRYMKNIYKEKGYSNVTFGLYTDGELETKGMV